MRPEVCGICFIKRSVIFGRRLFRDKQRQIQRQTDRQADRQTDRLTDRQTDRQTENNEFGLRPGSSPMTVSDTWNDGSGMRS